VVPSAAHTAAAEGTEAQSGGTVGIPRATAEGREPPTASPLASPRLRWRAGRPPRHPRRQPAVDAC
jgi:hypothetical protein